MAQKGQPLDHILDHIVDQVTGGVEPRLQGGHAAARGEAAMGGEDAGRCGGAAHRPPVAAIRDFAQALANALGLHRRIDYKALCRWPKPFRR